jgi:hypothetical protein
MKIDDDRLRTWGDRLPLVPCRYCAEVRRNVKNQAMALVDFDGSRAKLDGPIFPVAIVECAGCGRLEFFSAVGLGLHHKSPPKD